MAKITLEVEQRKGRWKSIQKLFQSFLLSAVFSLPFFLRILARGTGYHFEIPLLLQLALASLVQFVCGWHFYRSAYHALKAKRANRDLLIAVSTTAAYGYSLGSYLLRFYDSLYFEISAIVITLTLLGCWLEALEKRKDEQTSRNPVDRLSAFYMLVVFTVSMLTWLLAALFWKNSILGLANAAAVWIIACPCTLSLAVPLIAIMARNVGLRRGIVFNQALNLESLQPIHTLFFNLSEATHKRCFITGVFPCAKHPYQEIMQIAASLDRASPHSLAEALVHKAKDEGIALKNVKNSQYFPGKGIKGIIDERDYYLGYKAFAQEMGIDIDSSLSVLENAGETLLFVWSAKHLIGCLTFSNPMRESSLEAARLLKNRLTCLVGIGECSSQANQAIARSMEIEDVKAKLPPEGEQKRAQEARKQGKIAVMGGEEDWAALAQADLSLAWKTEHSLVNTVDVVIKRQDLMAIVEAIDLLSIARRKMKQNLFFAFAYNLFTIPLAVLGLLTPAIAAGTMTISLVSIIANALLLRYWKPKQQ